VDDIMEGGYDEWVPIGEAAKDIGIHHSTLVKACNRGEIDHMRIGSRGHRRIKASEIARVKRETRFARLLHNRIDSVAPDPEEDDEPIAAEHREHEQGWLLNPFGG